MSDPISEPSELELELANAWSELLRGDHISAHRHFETIISTNPECHSAWLGFGISVEKCGRTGDAINAFHKVTTLAPDSFDGWSHLGRLLIKEARFETAVQVLHKATEINPIASNSWSDLGSAQLRLNQFSQAEESLSTAVALNPRDVVAILNLGNSYREQGRDEEAVSVFQQAHHIAPTHLAAVTKLAETLSDLDKWGDALNLLDEFITKHPSSVEAHQVRALILLRSEKLTRGFDEYEWRLHPSEQAVPIRPYYFPRWQGEDLNSKKLLIWLEQGVGDEILSLRCWHNYLTGPEGRNCVIESDARLVTLLQRSYPNTIVVPRQDPPIQAAQKVDLVCPAWSGARYLPLNFSHKNVARSYLIPDPNLVTTLRNKYTKLSGGKTVVGLSWASGSKNRRQKMPPLESWASLVKNPRLFFVCLQFAPSEDDIQLLSEFAGGRLYVDSSIDATADLDGTAAQISALDKVVTISNTTAHIAGAIGTPTATLVPSGYGGFWYWHRDRNDSPWYPALSVFRSEGFNEWPSAIDEVRDWLLEQI